jgi:hypothetical protein
VEALMMTVNGDVTAPCHLEMTIAAPLDLEGVASAEVEVEVEDDLARMAVNVEKGEGLDPSFRLENLHRVPLLRKPMTGEATCVLLRLRHHNRTSHDSEVILVEIESDSGAAEK